MSGYSNFIGTAYEIFVATFLHFNEDFNNKIDLKGWHFESQVKIPKELSYFEKELSLDLYAINKNLEYFFECKYSANPITLGFLNEIFLNALVEFIGLNTYHEKQLAFKHVSFAFVTTHNINNLLQEKEAIFTESSEYVGSKVKTINDFIKSEKKWKNIQIKIDDILLKKTLLNTKIMNLDAYTVINNIEGNEKEEYFKELIINSSNIKKYDSLLTHINLYYNIKYFTEGEFIIKNIMGNKIKISKEILQNLNKYKINKKIETYNIIKNIELQNKIQYKYNGISEYDSLKYLNEAINTELFKNNEKYFFIIIPMSRNIIIFNLEYIINLSEKIFERDNKYHLKKIPYNEKITKPLFKIAIIEAKRIMGRIITDDLFIE